MISRFNLKAVVKVRISVSLMILKIWLGMFLFMETKMVINKCAAKLMIFFTFTNLIWKMFFMILKMMIHYTPKEEVNISLNTQDL